MSVGNSLGGTGAVADGPIPLARSQNSRSSEVRHESHAEQAGTGRGAEPWLVRHPAEWRQVGIVAVYWALLALALFVPACRNPAILALSCAFSFLNAVVIHNHLHRGIFHDKTLNLWWRRILSFGNLYPASANVPAHNLVHHHFEDDGKWDWADPRVVNFRWNLLNLIHFPNVAGPRTFNGVTRWAQVTKQPGFERQYRSELAFAFGLTGVLFYLDFWTTLFFVVVPQLYGARCILRINLIQHDRADIDSEWNHSRNFVGRGFNWIMCNNGYHTIHHNRAGLHWSELDQAHVAQVKARIDPRLDEPSMVVYLLRTYIFSWTRPPEVRGREFEATLGSNLPTRVSRREAAAEDAALEVRNPYSEAIS
jgi:beta-carotene hydroxylase